MVPVWLTIVSVVSLFVGFLSALWVLFDIVGRDGRQPMAVMDVVWPVTALYAGAAGLLLYRRYGAPAGLKRSGPSQPPGKPFWAGVAIGVTHCGAGCAIGDVVGATVVASLALEIAGLALWPEYIVEFSIAYVLGVAFQYLAIAPMRGLGLVAGLAAAVKADTLSLLAFEIGMFGWMAIVQLVFFPVHHLHPSHLAYWFLMQIAMLLGCLTAYPANWWLIRNGVKEEM
jgi:Domain of unknown function (DUF4396)